MAINQDGMVQSDGKGVGESLQDFLSTDPTGQNLASLTDDIQDGEVTINGRPYSLGRILDQMHESYAGSHDFISGTLSGFYDEKEMAVTGLEGHKNCL